MKTHLRTEWYNRPDVMSNIVPLLQGREVSFMKPCVLRTETGNYPVRCIKAHHSSYLLNNMRAFSFFSREYNLYHGIHRLQNMPMFSFKPLERTEQQQAFFRNYDNYVTGVDFVMDFDGDKTVSLIERIMQAQLRTVAVCVILKEYQVPYNVVFSGTKGFHIEVRGFPPVREWNKHASTFEEIATRLVLIANGEKYEAALAREDDLREYLKARYSFDNSIYTVTRIWKCPFSYDVVTDMIAYPLSDEELINFKIENYKVENMLQRNHWNIGLKTRPGKIENFWRMASALGVEHAIR